MQSMSLFYKDETLSALSIDSEIHRLLDAGNGALAVSRSRSERGALLLATDFKRSVVRALRSIGYSVYGYDGLSRGRDIVGFNGQFRDPSTGCDLLGNGRRAYSPVLMRFMSPDLLSPFAQGGINPYAYCGGDPLNFSDPTGAAKLRIFTERDAQRSRDTVIFIASRDQAIRRETVIQKAPPRSVAESAPTTTSSGRSDIGTVASASSSSSSGVRQVSERIPQASSSAMTLTSVEAGGQEGEYRKLARKYLETPRKGHPVKWSEFQLAAAYKEYNNGGSEALKSWVRSNVPRHRRGGRQTVNLVNIFKSMDSAFVLRSS
ncbi:hypothetical protein D3C79_476050 [compost metagenome]